MKLVPIVLLVVVFSPVVLAQEADENSIFYFVATLFEREDVEVDLALIVDDPAQAFSADEQKTWQLLYQFPELLENHHVVQVATTVDRGKTEFLLSSGSQKAVTLGTSPAALLFEETSNVCNPSVCGDGLLCEDEECDDGNVVNGDGCNAFCNVEVVYPASCGDGYLSVSEQCEPPGTEDAIHCRQNESQCEGVHVLQRDPHGSCLDNCQCSFDTPVPVCVKDQCGASCGNNFDCAVDERCDTASCSCVPRGQETCGNGIVESHEECDFAGVRIEDTGDHCSQRTLCVGCTLVVSEDTEHHSLEVCDGVDNDCDGFVDNVDVNLCVNQDTLCPNQVGVCAGSHQACVGAQGFEACSASSYNQSGLYEAQETFCDGLDNDCDGSIDEGCPCTIDQACGEFAGVCKRGVQSCANGVLQECVGDIKPSQEVCDALDNDCDGLVDECVTNSCGQCAEEGFETCNYRDDNCNAEELSPTRGFFNFDNQRYENFSHYCPPGKVCQGALADGIDNDGDGLVDEGIDEGAKWQEGPQWCEVCYDATKKFERSQLVESGSSSAHTNARKLVNNIFGIGTSLPVPDEYRRLVVSSDITGINTESIPGDIACCRFDQCIANGQCHDAGARFDADNDGSIDVCRAGEFLEESRTQYPTQHVMRLHITNPAFHMNEQLRGLPNPYMGENVFNRPGIDMNESRIVSVNTKWSDEHNLLAVSVHVFIEGAYGELMNTYTNAEGDRYTNFVYLYNTDGKLLWRKELRSENSLVNTFHVRLKPYSSKTYDLMKVDELSFTDQGELKVAGQITRHVPIQRYGRAVIDFFEVKYDQSGNTINTVVLDGNAVNGLQQTSDYRKDYVWSYGEDYIVMASDLYHPVNPSALFSPTTPVMVFARWNPETGVKWTQQFPGFIGRAFFYNDRIYIYQHSGFNAFFATIHELTPDGRVVASRGIDFSTIYNQLHALRWPMVSDADEEGMYFLDPFQLRMVKVSWTGNFIRDYKSERLRTEGNFVGHGHNFFRFDAFGQNPHSYSLVATEGLHFFDKKTLVYEANATLSTITNKFADYGIGDLQYGDDTVVLAWMKETSNSVVIDVYKPEKEVGKGVIEDAKSTTADITVPVSSVTQHSKIGDMNAHYLDEAYISAQKAWQRDSLESKNGVIIGATSLSFKGNHQKPSKTKAVIDIEKNSTYEGKIIVDRGNGVELITHTSDRAEYHTVTSDIEFFNDQARALLVTSWGQTFAGDENGLQGNHVFLADIVSQEPITSKEYEWRKRLFYETHHNNYNPLLDGNSFLGFSGDVHGTLHLQSSVPLGIAGKRWVENYHKGTIIEDELFIYHFFDTEEDKWRQWGQTSLDEINQHHSWVKNKKSNTKLKIYSKQGMKLLKEIDLGYRALWPDMFSFSAHNGRSALLMNDTLYFMSLGTPLWQHKIVNPAEFPIVEVGERGVYFIEDTGSEQYLVQLSYTGKEIARTNIDKAFSTTSRHWYTVMTETDQGVAYIVHATNADGSQSAKYLGQVSSFVHGQEQQLSITQENEVVSSVDLCSTRCFEYQISLACQLDSCSTQQCRWDGRKQECVDVMGTDIVFDDDQNEVCATTCFGYARELTCITDQCPDQECLWDAEHNQCVDTSTIVCGNGNQEYGESCDDGNTNSGDGCSAQCQGEFKQDQFLGFELTKNSVRSGAKVLGNARFTPDAPIQDIILSVSSPDQELTSKPNFITGDGYTWFVDTNEVQDKTFTFSIILTDLAGNSHSLTNVGVLEVTRDPYKLKVLAIPVRNTMPLSQFEPSAKHLLSHFVSNTPLRSCQEKVLIDVMPVNYQGTTATHECGFQLTRLYLFALDQGYDPDTYDLVIGLTNQDGSVCGQASRRSHEEVKGVSFANGGYNVVLASMDSPHVASHEMGHQFGLKEEYCSQDAGGGPFCSGSDPDLPNPLMEKYYCDPTYHPERAFQRAEYKRLNGKYRLNTADCCFERCSDSNFCCTGNRNDQGAYSIMSANRVHEEVEGATGAYVFHPEVQQYLGTFDALNCNE